MKKVCKNTLRYFCVKILKRHLRKNGGSIIYHSFLILILKTLVSMTILNKLKFCIRLRDH